MPCPPQLSPSLSQRALMGKAVITGRCNSSCPPFCSDALLPCADTVASIIAPALCLLDSKYVGGKEEEYQVDHHYMTYIQVFALMCGEKYKNSFFSFVLSRLPLGITQLQQ